MPPRYNVSKQSYDMQSNLVCHPGHDRPSGLLALKLTAFLLLVALLPVRANGYAQQLSINLKNVPIERVFKEIQKQSAYQFFYNERLLKQARNVSINVTNVPVE